MASKSPQRNNIAGLQLKLANLRTKSGYSVGVDTASGVLDVGATAKALGLPAPKDIDDLLQNSLGNQIKTIIDRISEQHDAAVFIDHEDVEFRSLVTRPEKIICVGFNYQKHAEETGTPIPKAPPLFSKFNNALNHHRGTVKLPTHTDDQFDFETELVIVFGQEFTNIAEADALDYVAGYTIGNDVSARQKQTETTQFLAGKASDGFAPIGPWLVTKDLVADPNKLRLQTHVNGLKKQDWTTADMIFDCKKIIAYVASIMTIKPGDILFTGTPQGVVFGEKAPAEQRRWLRAGDEVVSTIEGLGDLQVRFTGPKHGFNEPNKAVEEKKPATIDRLAVLNGGEAHVTDVSQWSPGVDEGKAAIFSNNAYLIKHGDGWMLWDTGLQDNLINTPGGKVVVHDVRGIVKKTLTSQLDELGVKAEEISHIAFSHAHFDHVGNSQYFSQARWYVQEAEHDAMFGPDYEKYGFIPELYETMRDRLTIVTGQKYDIFGDGSAVIYSTPGHTPGHQSLLVRLPERGPVVLSGDVAHFSSNFLCRRVPLMNASKDDTKQSIEKINAILRAEGAELWINHDYEQNQTIPHSPSWIF